MSSFAVLLLHDVRLSLPIAIAMSYHSVGGGGGMITNQSITLSNTRGYCEKRQQKRDRPEKTCVIVTHIG